MMALTAVERELRGAMVRARKRGLRIKRRSFGVKLDGSGRIVPMEGRECCALGAWALGKREDVGMGPGQAVGAAVSRKFRWGTGAYQAFLHAFDGVTRTDERIAFPEIVALAERLAKKFVTSRRRRRRT
jgi:hypothetical protein